MPFDMSFFHDLPVLELDRLRMRPFRVEDAADVYRYTSDPRVTAYMTWEPHPDEGTTETFIRHLIAAGKAGQPTPWALEDRVQRRVIGSCGFGEISPGNWRGSIGYVLSPDYWSGGYMTEAVRGLVACAFEQMGLNRVAAYCVTGNTGSARVAEKAGMRLEGRLRSHVFIGGGWYDQYIYAITRSDYLSTREGN